MSIEDTKAVENQSAATETEVIPVDKDDAEARIALLEAERNKAIEEAANYKLGMLKAKGKLKEEFENSEDESEDEKIERIVNEKLSKTKIAQIDTAKEELLKKLAKENKELKLAQLNKTTTTPTTMGIHSESTPVKDTIVTPDQMSAFKAKGWNDKDIERYKKNLLKYGGR